MPQYDFSCNTCGVFTLDMPMSETGKPIHCPDCRQHANRIYQNISLLRTERNLAKRIEQSALPKVMKYQDIPGTKRHQHGHSPARPWQISH